MCDMLLWFFVVHSATSIIQNGEHSAQEVPPCLESSLKSSEVPSASADRRPCVCGLRGAIAPRLCKKQAYLLARGRWILRTAPDDEVLMELLSYNAWRVLNRAIGYRAWLALCNALTPKVSITTFQELLGLGSVALFGSRTWSVRLAARTFYPPTTHHEVNTTASCKGKSSSFRVHAIHTNYVSETVSELEGTGTSCPLRSIQEGPSRRADTPCTARIRMLVLHDDPQKHAFYRYACEDW